tara:strand:+ start:288 stop:869 length:582 start_codon:yes stop_codon:yes gene_type:complete
MAAIRSTMLELGTKAPPIQLPIVTGGEIDLYNHTAHGKGTVVLFICNHCPYVHHINEVLVSVANDYTRKGISFIAISSNDAIRYPEDSPEKMMDSVRKHSYPFPYLYDESQSVAKAYRAACTPDFYFFDKKLSLYYRGQFDASRPGNELEVTGIDLTTAIDGYLKGEEARVRQVPSMGCSIKWKAGNEPDYLL